VTGAEIRGRLLGVALGTAPADLLAVGGDVVNVYAGEVVRWEAIPALRLTTRGLLAVKSREHVPALL
jgi:hypothetical protein